MTPSTISTESSPHLFELTEAKKLLEQGRYEAALRCFHEAETLSVLSADNYVSQGVCLLHLARHQEALQACDRALALEPDHQQAWLFRGVASHRLGYWREAYACYDRATGQQLGQWTLESSPWGAWLSFLKSLVKGIFNGRRSHLRVH
ncbi:MAG: tetratricopeptide repeat protein [Cyanobacteria bacterium P01_F01_bin.86]